MIIIDREGEEFIRENLFDIAVPIEASAYTYEGLPFYYNDTVAMYFNVSDGDCLLL